MQGGCRGRANGQADHVWSLMAGSLYMPGVKKGVKRAEQMEEREAETEWADGGAGKERTVRYGEV